MIVVPVVYRWLGNAFYPDIPGRDLTQADLDALSDDLRKLVDSLGIYEKVGA